MIVFSFSACSLFSRSSESESIVSSYINEKGELIVQYSSGNYQNLGVVVGKDGEDGKDGIDGKDGLNGKDGKDGEDGKDGNSISNSTSITMPVADCIQSTVVIQSEFLIPDKLGVPTEAFSTGSGVIYEFNKEYGSALIVTNYHVVFNNNDLNTTDGISNNINVFLYGHLSENQAITATYVGGSMQYDLALLEIKNSDLIRTAEIKKVDIRSSDEVYVGESVFAIGNPKASGFSVTSGIVSVDSETIEMMAADEVSTINIRVMRTDTPINSGNSGGGLFDENGHLIGIVNAKYFDSSIDNIGYAIPSSTMVTIIENIKYYCLDKEFKNVQRPLLGITVEIKNPYSKYNEETGLVDLYENSTVVLVTEGSLAEGKLFEGDILRKIEISGSTNQSVEITRQYKIEMLINARVGDIVTVTVERDGNLVIVPLEITRSCFVSV